MTAFSLRWSYRPLSISLRKSVVVPVSGTTAPRNLPIPASNRFRPSKNTTSSPRDATSSFTSRGARCRPPPMMPFPSTRTSSGTPNVTISSRTRTRNRGKSLPVPFDHLKSMSRNGAYSRVRRLYVFTDSRDPPTVPLMPCGEMMIRPFSPSDSQSVCCQSRMASGSATGVKQ